MTARTLLTAPMSPPTLRFLLAAVICCSTGPAAAETAPVVLFKGVRIFNGVDAQLRKGDVLVEGDTIVKISRLAISAPRDATVIEGKGRILSPGFIDLHTHLTAQLPKAWRRAHPWVNGMMVAKAAEHALMSGFTTIRDAGGTHPDVARAIDTGLFPGPRVFPCGAVITQTAGHGDSRRPDASHPTLGDGHAHLGEGRSVIADGVPLTLAAVRENLKNGATQIKIMGGGGVMSDYDPIFSLQPSPAEIRAAVQAAEDFGTYVMAHAYTSEAVTRLVNNGVRVIEHGLLIDDKTARLCKKRGVAISTQVLIFRLLKDLPGLTARNKKKLKAVLAGQDNLMRLIKRYGIKTGFGTDLILGAYVRANEEFIVRGEYFSPIEILRQATSESAKIIRLSRLNRHGRFGEIREGWKADLLLIEGDPLKDISVLAKPDTALAVIMKDGRIIKRRD